MNSADAFLSGRVEARDGIEEVVALLVGRQVPAFVGALSHFQSGAYVRVQHGESRITGERDSAESYLLRGEAPVVGELEALAFQLSLALQDLGFAHVIEIYDEEDNPVCKFSSSPGG